MNVKKHFLLPYGASANKSIHRRATKFGQSFRLGGISEVRSLGPLSILRQALDNVRLRSSKPSMTMPYTTLSDDPFHGKDSVASS
ncbi:hypothetical protein BC792_10433 [Sphingobacterium allocomposti]|uniref:Uncharacterized protein n=1 Tax=Sphingobacterium allocomposti TaxID=415956 RepID=A0A5S5DPQ3_9SPHI|nr:hypothetical protein BC792_10433 [Sphingobacterium composti Yoo et al. 2007 non Ten et al. 2007]